MTRLGSGPCLASTPDSPSRSPHRALGDAALAAGQRARRQPCRLPLRAGALPAPRGPRRRAPGRGRHRGPRFRGPGDPRGRLGLRRPASCSRPRRPSRSRRRAVAVAGVAAAMTTIPVEIAPGAGLRRRHLGVVVRRRTRSRSPRPTRRDCSSTGPSGCAAHAAVAARHGVAAAGPGEQVLRRPGRHPHHPAADPAPAALRRDGHRRARASSTRWPRSRRRSAAAGSTSPTAAATGTPSSPRCPSCWPRSSPRPAVEAGTYDLVIHPSNLWLTIHESIGHATELDRALGYEANYAGTSFATFDKLGTLQYGSTVMNVTGDRTVEHGLATIGYDDEGVADPALGHRPRRRAGRLPARPADGPPAAPSSTAAAPTAAPTPTPPATSRSSGWPTSRCSPAPTTSPPRT